MTPQVAAPAITRAPSLGRRLWLWLAAQGLLGAMLVSGSVYAVNAWTLQSRQHELLKIKSGVVSHELAESAASASLAELRHRLTGFLAGHEDMLLSVSTEDGRMLFDSDPVTPATGARRRLKTVAWQDTWPAADGTAVRVALGLNVRRDDALLAHLGWIVFAASLAGAILMSLTGYALVRRGLKPLHSLTEQLDAMTPGQSGVRLEGRAQPSELRPLVEHFNALLSRVEGAYRQLEGFNANVAHELRTPLTTLIGSSELALRAARPADELREVIAGNLEDLQRLAVIVNDMLFLSQADRGAPARRAPVASLARSLAEIVEFHEPVLLENELTAVIVGDATGSFDVSLLRRALSNLLSNAARHATPGSAIRVQLETPPGQLRLSVHNRGSTIEPAQLPRLFERFYRLETARHKGAAKQFGLGLAIVAAIARMHGGKTFASSAEGLTVIGLELPASPPLD
ncbi:MAG: heavy metal sensor histidine kinase [Rubrivivax sp.]|nr:heavy metal sensor histidine kinase [Rubrivivax sp.]